MEARQGSREAMGRKKAGGLGYWDACLRENVKQVRVTTVHGWLPCMPFGMRNVSPRTVGTQCTRVLRTLRVSAVISVLVWRALTGRNRSGKRSKEK